MRHPPAWMDNAHCLSVPPDTMFPTDYPPGKRHGAELHAAQQVCADCPVAPECMVHAARVALEFEHENGSGTGYTLHGVWSGRPATYYTPERSRVILQHAAQIIG